MFKINWIFLILALVSISACNRSKLEGSDPKRVLTDYISKSFVVHGIEDRAQLISYMTGDVKARLASWSEDQFREAFVEAKREFVKLSFRDIKEISPTEVQITYELVYFEKNKDKKGLGLKGGKVEQNSESKVTTKKLCQLMSVDGKWYIADVRNIKELVEFKNSLSLP